MVTLDYWPIRTLFELLVWNILNKGGLIEGELNYIEIYLSYISKTIDESFPNPHLIITEHPDKWLGTDVLQTRPTIRWSHPDDLEITIKMFMCNTGLF